MAGRVAVVGATGQIGRPLWREPTRTGHAVRDLVDAEPDT